MQNHVGTKIEHKTEKPQNVRGYSILMSCTIQCKQIPRYVKIAEDQLEKYIFPHFLLKLFVLQLFLIHARKAF